MLKTTLSFRSLLRFNVFHEYYAQRFCRDFDFYPTASTQVWLKKMDLVYKVNDFGFEIGYNMDRQEIISYFLEQEDLLKLSFVLFPKNPFFFNFTNLPFVADSTFYVSNLNPNVLAENDLRLHKANFLGKEDLFPIKEAFFDIESAKENQNLEILDINSRTVFQKVLLEGKNQVDISDLPAGKYALTLDKKIVEEFVFANFKSASKPLVFIDFFWVSPTKNKKKYDLYSQNTVTSRLYHLVFQNRSTIWKYYVVPKYANNFTSLQLETSNNSKFSKAVETQISDGSKAFLFVSEQPLELKEITNYEFQLKKQQRSDTSKVVIKRMPVANNKLIKPEKDYFFSEILVYV